jgi:ABC-2 type transport system permease protein
VWYNPTLRSQYSMVPALIAIVLIMPAMATALGATRERQTGTFETLVTTPIKGTEYLMGKLAAYMSTGLAGTLLALAVAVFWFGVPFRGSLLLYLLLTADYFLAMMGACLFVSNFTNSQQTATVVILLAFFMPSFFQSGLWLPVDTSSPVSTLSSYMLPSTHFMTISRWIALRASGPDVLWREVLMLVGMGLSSLAASVFLFKKKVG